MKKMMGAKTMLPKHMLSHLIRRADDSAIYWSHVIREHFTRINIPPEKKHFSTKRYSFAVDNCGRFNLQAAEGIYICAQSCLVAYLAMASVKSVSSSRVP